MRYLSVSFEFFFFCVISMIFIQRKTKRRERRSLVSNKVNVSIVCMLYLFRLSTFLQDGFHFRDHCKVSIMILYDLNLSTYSL